VSQRFNDFAAEQFAVFDDPTYWTNVALRVGDQSAQLASPFHPALNNPAMTLKEAGLKPDDVLELARFMTTAMQDIDAGVALAVPQLGIPLRMAIIMHPDMAIDPEVMKIQGRTNFEPIALADLRVEILDEKEVPKWMRNARPTNGTEGCITISAALHRHGSPYNDEGRLAFRPEDMVVFKVDRPLYGRVTGTRIGGTHHGQPYSVTWMNYPLREVLHEVGHFDGIFCSRIAKDQRTLTEYLELKVPPGPQVRWRSSEMTDRRGMQERLTAIMPNHQLPYSMRETGLWLPT
jgi:peptide deformylase